MASGVVERCCPWSTEFGANRKNLPEEYRMNSKNEKSKTGKFDVLILGGGPADIQAARMIKSHSPDSTVAVARPEDFSIIYCALPYAIEGLFPLNKCYKTDELVSGTGAGLIRDKAVKVDFKKREAYFEQGGSAKFDKLLIATGAVPARPPVPGSERRK